MIPRLFWVSGRVIASVLFAVIDHAGIALRWMLSDVRHMAIAGLALVALGQHVALSHANALSADRLARGEAWHGQFRAQKAEMLKLVGLVRAARAKAAEQDRQNKARVQADWRIISNEVSHGYQAELAGARADLARWMRERAERTGAACAIGGGGQAGLPALSALPAGPVRAGDTAALDGADAEAVTENTLRLEHLIDAWKRATAIDVNGR